MSSQLEELYHNCRYCRYFENGKCLHYGTFSSSIDIEKLLYGLSEDGILNEAIIEGFSNEKFSDLRANLGNSNLSKKKAKEIMGDFFDELDSVQRGTWSISIEEAVIHAIINSMPTEKSAEPDNPDEFYCRYFE